MRLSRYGKNIKIKEEEEEEEEEEEGEEEEEEVCILRRIIYERLPSKTSLHMIAALL